MGGSEVFGIIVGNVDVAGCPENVEVALADAITDPVEAHVHGAAAFLFDGVIDYTVCACVVRLNGGGWLRMSHGNEDCAEHFGVFGVVEKGTEFCFCG